MKRVVAIVILVCTSFVVLHASNDSIMKLPSYREFFTDSCLKAMIEQAMDSNIDLRSARMKIIQADANLDLARNALLPRVTLDANTDVQHLNGSWLKTYKVGATPSWEIDIFGKQTNVNKSAEVSLDESFAYVQTVQTELVVAVAKSYYTLLMFDEQKRVGELSLRNWQVTMQTLEALRDAGQNNDVAVLQAKANIFGLQSNLLCVDKSIADMESSICVLLNKPLGHIKRTTIAEQYFDEDMAINGIPLQIIDNRPDVRQARLQLIAAGYDASAVRAQFYPQITLSGFIGWTNSGVEITSPGNFILNAVGMLAMPLINRGAIKANLKYAQAVQGQAEMAFQKSVIVAAQQVNDALTQWQSAIKQIEICNKQIETLKECVQKTQWLMDNSSVSYIEVLVAEQSLLAAQTSLVQYNYSRIEAMIMLYRTIGGTIE